uniref:Uncharacterized protein n=1 Tax=Peronospora matthiolae TaxID=2874970 RepID=A0AAV1VNR0_9STRA
MENTASASSLPREYTSHLSSARSSGVRLDVDPDTSGTMELSTESTLLDPSEPDGPNEFQDTPSLPPASSLLCTLEEDDPMESAIPSAHIGVASRGKDTRPTMADVIARHERLRRDNADDDAARRRVETPKPLACDIEAIERQYAAGNDWSFIAMRIDQARPYELPRAKYDMVIDTGRTFAKTPLQKIMASLTGKSHGSDVLERLYASHAIGQISKLPGGNLRVKVKSKEACLLLGRTKVNILGGCFLFKEFDVLSAKYFIDISSIDSDTPTDLILQRLFQLGCQPVYDTFRDVNLATGLTSATWSVYFLSTTCPSALMINGLVCDQVLFDNKLHPAHGKNAPYQSERLPFGYRSHHGLDLGTTDGQFPPPETAAGSTPSPTSSSHSLPRQPIPSKSYAQAARATPIRQLTSLPKAVEEAKTRTSQPQRGAQHGKHSAASQLAKVPPTSTDTLSISSFNDSNGKISPPSSPKAPKKLLLLTNGPEDNFVTASNKKKRSRKATDFSNLMVKQQPTPLDGIATANYFQALQSMSVTFESKNVTADKTYGVRYHVAPVDVKRPDSMKTSTESAFFVEKHHTKIKKASKATPIMEVTEAMLDDENTALLSVLPDRLAEADTKVDGVCKLFENATNPDHITKKAIECPLAFNSTMALKMAGDGHEIAELAQMHVINRVFSATCPGDDTTFSAKRKKLMGSSVPSKRGDIFKMCAKWWTSSASITELSREALGIFELTLMSIAPTIFTNDHWIQYITGQPVRWIPAHHTRLLHPNTLLRLLRSDLGSLCMQQWREVQWQGHLLDDLESLRTLDGFYPDDSSVLQLRVVDGDVVMVASNLATRC